MHGLAERLEVVKHDLRDQADYLQHLLEQFDVDYESCCTLLVSVAELRTLSERLNGVMLDIPKPKKARLPAARRRAG